MNKDWRRPKPLIPAHPGFDEKADIQRWLDIATPGIEAKKFAWLEHAIRFIKQKGGRSQETYRGLRSELERFLLYCFAHDLSPEEMRAGDINKYFEFCQEPPTAWVMRKHYHRFESDDRPNPLWRPFFMKAGDVSENAGKVKRLQVSQSMINRQYSFLNQWYKDLIDYEMVRKNPIPVAKKDSKLLLTESDKAEPKGFNKEEWIEIMKILQTLADADPKWERALFVILLMKTCYLRIGDLASKSHYIPSMSDFYYHRDYLFLYVMSKRKKARSVSVPIAMEPFIVRYRQTRGLDGLPLPGEKNHPLIAKDLGKGNVGIRQLNRIVQAAFSAIAKSLKPVVEETRQAMAQETDKELKKKKATEHQKWRLLQARVIEATPHALRHTGASIDALWRPIPELAEELGHADPGTTGRIYINSSRADRAISGSTRSLAGPPEQHKEPIA